MTSTPDIQPAYQYPQYMDTEPNFDAFIRILVQSPDADLGDSDLSYFAETTQPQHIQKLEVFFWDPEECIPRNFAVKEEDLRYPMTVQRYGDLMYILLRRLTMEGRVRGKTSLRVTCAHVLRTLSQPIAWYMARHDPKDAPPGFSGVDLFELVYNKMIVTYEERSEFSPALVQSIFGMSDMEFWLKRVVGFKETITNGDVE